MELTLMIVSSICWEIITTKKIQVNFDGFPVFKFLIESIYDFCPQLFEQELRLYWRYSHEDFWKITDNISFSSFVNLNVEPNLYLVMGDAEKFYNYTENFLKILDLMELQKVKAKERNKYDLQCEADEIAKEIKRWQESLDRLSYLCKTLQNDRDILRFALRKMPMGRCYTADICSGYSLIDCVRKGWPKTKKVLVPIPDEVIERRAKKDKPDKKGKPENPSKKDKKKKVKK